MMSIAVIAVLVMYVGALLERRRAEAAYRQAALFEQLLDALPEPSVVLGPGGRIRQLNRSAEQLFGYRGDRVLGQDLSLLLANEQSKSHDLALRQLLCSPATNLGYAATVDGRCADGSQIALQLKARSFTHEHDKWVVATFRDLISDQQLKAALQRHLAQLLITKDALQKHNLRLEEQVQEQTAQLSKGKDAAERANSAKSDFLSNMSHELRTPLHGILSFARFGVRKIDSVDQARLLSYFQRIESSGQTLLRLLDNLLDLSKLEAGRVELSCEPVNPSALLETVTDEFAALAREKGLTLIVPTDETASRVWGDPDKLSQVMRNVFGNAIKFSPQGGTITATVTQGRELVVLSVRDQGSGIPDSECETVFDKFVQSKLTRTGAGGTGLGLAICREIVALHGGRIYAEPTHGQGALIRICLPVQTPNDEAGARPVVNQMVSLET